VTNAQVAEALHEQLGVNIDRHKIDVKDGIKALGTYPIEIRLGNNIIAKSAVQVVALK
jgi:large subunit ribosomal protein L9